MSLNGKNRADVKIGAKVKTVLKADQRTGRLAEGVVVCLLTKSRTHPHGIKMVLEDGQVGRVQKIVEEYLSPLSALKRYWKNRLPVTPCG
ncbi:YwbE family protein [Lacrimispora indolis]|uniref:YwbE family protein n=1 Tax=Lacrimispora indolis TaxID=69825 RepID=UPI0003FEF706|nr:YwbE family protein [[Clostridium] methoxybenzovorans]